MTVPSQKRSLKKACKAEVETADTMAMVQEALVLTTVCAIGLFLGKLLHWAVSMTIALLTVLGVVFPDMVMRLLPKKIHTMALATDPATSTKSAFDDEDAASTTAGSDSESDHDVDAAGGVGGRIPIQTLLHLRPAKTPPPFGSLQAMPIPGCNFPSSKAKERLESAAQRSAEISSRWAALDKDENKQEEEKATSSPKKGSLTKLTPSPKLTSSPVESLRPKGPLLSSPVTGSLRPGRKI
jgi:hypothetical protein